jgi:hypothetical protein
MVVSWPIHVDDDTVEHNLASEPVTRLSDIDAFTQFGTRFGALSSIDEAFRQIKFNLIAAKGSLTYTHAAPLVLAFGALVLGSWDLGSGELSSGGDYNRGGIFGSESGFLHVTGGALVLSFLSLFISVAAYVLLMVIFPLMRENIIYLIFGILAVEYGHIASHASDPYFPMGSDLPTWAGVIIGNGIILFVGLGVVRRSVMETRDFHVEVSHIHPDPRRMRSAHEDHSLLLWNISLFLWLLFLNLSAWSASHAVARPAPIVGDTGGFVALHIMSGLISFALLMHVSWYPQFMMGSSGGSIQSRLARVVSEGIGSEKIEVEIGTCPDCGVTSSASREGDGWIVVSCRTENCEGRGIVGKECGYCGVEYTGLLACGSCGATSNVEDHFSTQGELW